MSASHDLFPGGRATRDALAEMRRLVSVLREHPAPDPEGRSPAAGLGDLPRLVADMAAVGLVVDVRIEGDLAAVPPGLSLTAKRVPAEATSRSAPEDSGDELTRRYIEAESLASCQSRGGPYTPARNRQTEEDRHSSPGRRTTLG